MESFLKGFSRYVVERYGDKVSDFCFVFSNKRAGLFFKKYLSEACVTPIWSPKVGTFDVFTGEETNRVVADRLQFIFLLYKVYKKVLKIDEDFEEFYSWGELLLNDFDEVDRYLINVKDLFQNLLSLKDIERRFEYLDTKQIAIIKKFWQQFKSPIESVHKNQFLSFWRCIHTIYVSFKELLDERGIGYEGLIYREVAERILRGEEMFFTYKRYFFVGFNELDKCQELVFDYLKEKGKASFYWDYDNYYLKNEKQEAGFFLRRNIKMFPTDVNFKVNYDNWSNGNGAKKIDIISMASEVGQVKYVNELLKGLYSDKDMGDNDVLMKTVIILPDEKLLVPLLQSLPNKIGGVNITMGYSLRYSAIYSFIELLGNLHTNVQIDRHSYYYKDVLAILYHHFLSFEDLHIVNELKQNIIKNNLIYITPKELGGADGLSLVFKDFGDGSSISDYLLDILRFLHRSISVSSDSRGIEKEFLSSVYKEVNLLKSLIIETDTSLDVKMYFRLLRKRLQACKLPFLGEPLLGLQVMGIMESRLLDFENVIILSMNEGTLPPSSLMNTFIPHNLRRGFGLPSVEQHDAVYSYYFYRLIQRAKNVSLLYNSKSEGMNSGELSRFALQLKYEMSEGESYQDVQEKNIGFDICISETNDINIIKSNDILEKLKKYFSSGDGGGKSFSPSAINSYLDCRLKFYFRYIAGLSESEEVTEDIDPVTLGNIYHYAMELLYTPYVGRVLKKEEIGKIRKNKGLVSEVIQGALNKQYFKKEGGGRLKGKNILIVDILRKYIDKTLEVDGKRKEFKLLGLEERFKIAIPISIGEGSYEVGMRGIIDRVDYSEGVVYVIDYKTGKVNDVDFNFYDMRDLFDRENKGRRKILLQTFLYAYYYLTKAGVRDAVAPAIYSFRQMFGDLANFNVYQQEREKKKSKVLDFKFLGEKFKEEMRFTLEEIFNPDVSFSQTENRDICRYCSYNKICGRG